MDELISFLCLIFRRNLFHPEKKQLPPTPIGPSVSQCLPGVTLNNACMPQCHDACSDLQENAKPKTERKNKKIVQMQKMRRMARLRCEAKLMSSLISINLNDRTPS
jgi:hypothetical protein